MLVVVAILLIFGAVVRHKWRNAAARKEEILRILAATSHEEDEIAELQGVDVYESPAPPPMQIQKRYYCAVCFSSTATRCSRCKAVRYCSGKCQIIHWRQGHKDECRAASSLQESKESASSVVTASLDQIEIISNNDSEVRSGPTEQLDDNGSLCSSLRCLSSSSSEHSKTSFDVSSSDTFESGPSIETDRMSSGGIDYHTSQGASDSDEADVPSVCVSPLKSTVQVVNNKRSAKKKENSQNTDPDGCFQVTNTEDSGSVAAVSEDCVGATDVRSSQSLGSSKTSSSVENNANPAHTRDKVTKSMNSRKSGSHQKVSIIDIRNSPFSKSFEYNRFRGLLGK